MDRDLNFSRPQEDLWAGLNRPGMDVAEIDAAIFGIPYDGGVSFRAGAKEAPNALRQITYTICPTTEDFRSFADMKVRDFGNCTGNRDEMFHEAEELTAELVRQGKFFTMIGGDHSTTIPILRGINKAVEEPFGIIHLDAHFDLCHEMGGDLLAHGCTERRALELSHVENLDRIFFVGLRSIESQELQFLQDKSIQLISAKEVRKSGAEQVVEAIREKMGHLKKIYITLDIDVLDPAYAPGTGTPQFGGLDGRELLDILEGLFHMPVIGMDIVEMAPVLDSSQITLFAARKIITECWGHHYYRRLQSQHSLHLPKWLESPLKEWLKGAGGS